MMKKYIALCALLTISFSVLAEEGMWLPMLLKQLEGDMQKNGLKLSAEDIYSINKSSLKDAVVHFNGGCTGQLVSTKGLLITNHHCGFSAISFLSTIENDYLKNGFWAYKMEDEKPAAGLVVTFIINIEDVTAKIAPSLNDKMTTAERSKVIKELSSKLEREAVAGTHYEASVKPFFYGNDFYLFTTETFKDIRLVGTPPSSIGNFGGETDNWVWPRHNGDFSMFRIYAGKDNKPAAYSKDNVPYVPRSHFTISTAGVKEGAFTMVYGFPGTTQEYLPSYAVDLIQNVQDPNRVAIRGERVDIIDQAMRSNDTIRLEYAAKTQRLRNAYKKWDGEMAGLKKYDAVGKKQKQEADFIYWTSMNADGKKYQSVLNDFKSVYQQYKPLSNAVDYTNEAAFGIEILTYAKLYGKLSAMCAIDSMPDSLITKEADRLLKSSVGYFKNYRVSVDKKVFTALMKMYCDSVDGAFKPEYVKEQQKKFNNDYNAYADYVFSKSFMTNYQDVEKMLTNFKRKSAKKINSDPAYALYYAIAKNYDALAAEKIIPLNDSIARLQRNYMQAQRLFQKDKMFYPDANSTLRFTFGNVKGYYPRDGVYYKPITTLSGIMEKRDDTNDDFVVPAKLKTLFDNKDFGRYEVNGDVPVAFIATNHTTGGNSGSPVLNANGELIGTNFDRVWEGTMSDIMYDPSRCRNISLDVRYTLFIIDKFAGAKNLIDEMDIKW
jgi:hypothetical protein